MGAHLQIDKLVQRHGWHTRVASTEDGGADFFPSDDKWRLARHVWRKAIWLALRRLLLLLRLGRRL